MDVQTRNKSKKIFYFPYIRKYCAVITGTTIIDDYSTAMVVVAAVSPVISSVPVSTTMVPAVVIVAVGSVSVDGGLGFGELWLLLGFGLWLLFHLPRLRFLVLLLLIVIVFVIVVVAVVVDVLPVPGVECRDCRDRCRGRLRPLVVCRDGELGAVRVEAGVAGDLGDMARAGLE